ncbi:SpoIIE family protein phosphatase [Acetivibrio clariflavus]|uniref:Stage 0 sporulation protein A homolog n=1 Tax=Acetivibrio clariflavus (strain DSM 19732 / NBRC 101661 / EBR45) TaxID=720554 RepID=G8M0P8_ACECE|nr:response regulator [Acetivibrio clariflavus]AEV69129.1 response regulator with CheY-like receiver, AAA-type ATPase, and DNA-binding domains [Acetivibrio clariflavus DSM 19732]
MSKILVIDNEITTLDNIKFALELENNEVITFSNSETGLDYFNKNYSSIDVVLTNIKMPNISGIEILRKIKKIMPEMGVIILTDHGDLETAIQVMKEGAFEYITKPITNDKLTIAINNAINKKNLLLENARIHRELLEHKNYLQGLHDSAEKILKNMLPKKLPDISGFDFAVEYKSCDSVGGDMYDISDIGDYICFYVFDVSSHGILASVISTIIKSFLKNIEYNYKQGINKRRFPEIVLDLNMMLLSNTEQNVFATLLLGFIDKKSKTLYTVSAGHINQFIIRKDGSHVPLESTGPILGVFEDAMYNCCVNQLYQNDKIWLFTDGLIEASPDEETPPFGEDMLLSLLKKNTGTNLADTVKEVVYAVKNYSKETFFDDITLLGIEVR